MRVPVPPRQALLLAALGVVASVVLIEVGARLATGSWSTLRVRGGEDYHVVDPVIGHVPRPGTAIRHPSEGFQVTIGAHGTRLNGDTPARAERPLRLAVGDSFAFGDDVDDEDSWPAILERHTGARVINAGVPGFGLDQAVLRAEQLAAVYAPDTIVVGFIPHDVLRCQMSYWSGNAKPHFDLDDAELRWHAAPTPPAPWYAPLMPLLAMSATVDLLFPTFLHWEGPYEVHAHAQARAVACALMARLATLSRATGARVVVLAHPQQPTSTAEHVELKDGVLACAATHDLVVVDLFPTFDALPLEQRAALFRGHLTPRGNRLVATQLADRLAAPAPDR